MASSDDHVGAARNPDVSGVYIHVPFCASKCPYCSFMSVPSSELDEGVYDRYVAAVVMALEFWKAVGVLESVTSVYIGGGTPSVLGHRLAGLVAATLAALGARSFNDVTVESNPGTFDQAHVAHLRDAGVTRHSIGVQSFDDSTLRRLGRAHSALDAERAVRVASESGARVSVDLLCGVAGQSMASWHSTLVSAVKLGVGHVSVYPLSIDTCGDQSDATAAARCDQVSTLEAGSDVAANMMQLAAELLGDAGFERYEVASYARRGHESAHNVGYWTGRSYLGVGPSAASMLSAQVYARARERHGHGGDVGYDPPSDAHRVRFVTAGDVEAFLKTPVCFEGDVEFLSQADALREDAMLGLRMSRGISCDLARVSGVTGVLKRLSAVGLVEEAGGRYRPTERGWLLGNEIFTAVWQHGREG